MLVTPGDVTTMTFDWGSIKWFVTPYAIPGASSSLGEVIVNPGKGPCAAQSSGRRRGHLRHLG
jgi:hypothetical protein